MSNIALPSVEAPTRMLDVSRAALAPNLAAQFQAAVQQSGNGPGAVVRSYAKRALGPGRVSFADFIKLRLFDEGFHPNAKPDAYVGARRNRDFCLEINHRVDWFGLLGNKVAALSYLEAYGLPTLPILAIFAPGVTPRDARTLPDEAALAGFLREASRYPLFGKPVEGCQSLGSVGLRRLVVGTGRVERLDGQLAEVESLAGEIATHYPDGYLFQSLARPDAEIERLCGRRLATVRMVTMLTEDGPRLFRAAWKIPAGGHAADNFWRAGNLLASLDLADGRVKRAVCGVGTEGREIAAHPDTGMLLPGLQHPDWQGMRRLALEAARLMRHVPMIGWDIACTETGSTIVEMNELPDFFLVQYAEGRGVLDDDFKRFVAFQRRQARAEQDAGKAAIRKL